MDGIVIEGEAAAEERQRLLEDGKEVPLGFRERDASGRKKTTRLQFGMNGSTAWVFCEQKKDGSDTKTILEEVLAHEAANLFGGYLERLELCQCLVDPSPLSPAFVEVCPCLDHMIDDLKEVFGINVSLS
jgi:hypothetical protein